MASASTIEDHEPDQTDESSDSESAGGWTLTRVVTLAAGGFILLVILIFVVALLLAFADATYWSDKFQIIRDVVVIVLTVQGILIITAIAILIIQIARFINLLRSESGTLLNETRDTMRTAKTTVQYVGENAKEPIIQTRGFIAGLVTFIRELIKIRRLLRPDGSSQEEALENPVDEIESD